MKFKPKSTSWKTLSCENKPLSVLGQLGECPHERVHAVGALDRGQRGEAGHLLFQLREHADVVDPALLVERRRGFRPDDLAARRPHRPERDVRVHLSQQPLDQIAAIVHFADHPVAVEFMVT